MRHTSQVAAGAALALILPLAACGNGDASPQPGSTETSIGDITIACGNVEDLCEHMIQAFTKSTGIGANYVRMSGGEIIARLESTKDAEKAEFDVWYGGPAESFATGAERGLLEAYDAPGRANLDSRFIDADGYWSGYSVNPIGLCSNTGVLGKLGVDAPAAWADLANPALKAQVSTPHPATAGTGFTYLATLVANHGDDDAAFAFLETVHPNVLQYTKSGSAPVQMLVRGEVGVVAAYMSVCQRENVVNGNDSIAMSYPSEGVGFETAAVGMVNGASNVAGGHAFIDWVLTDEAFQEHLAAGYNVFPSTKEGGDNGLGQTIDEIPISPAFDPVESGKRRVELAERFEREIIPAPAE